jgi:hypothetical protein
MHALLSGLLLCFWVIAGAIAGMRPVQAEPAFVEKYRLGFTLR